MRSAPSSIPSSLPAAGSSRAYLAALFCSLPIAGSCPPAGRLLPRLRQFQTFIVAATSSVSAAVSPRCLRPFPPPMDDDLDARRHPRRRDHRSLRSGKAHRAKRGRQDSRAVRQIRRAVESGPSRKADRRDAAPCQLRHRRHDVPGDARLGRFPLACRPHANRRLR